MLNANVDTAYVADGGGDAFRHFNDSRTTSSGGNDVLVSHTIT
jgi:hypothetical protein